jgi:hypothetical protein
LLPSHAAVDELFDGRVFVTYASVGGVNAALFRERHAGVEGLWVGGSVLSKRILFLRFAAKLGVAKLTVRAIYLMTFSSLVRDPTRPFFASRE